MNSTVEPMRVGVVGVGSISDTFIGNTKDCFDNLENSSAVPHCPTSTFQVPERLTGKESF